MNRQELKEHLQKLGACEIEPDSAMLGLCRELATLVACPDLLEEACEKIQLWGDHSGSTMFPVPHPTKSACEAYLKCPYSEMWNPNHPYGAARRRLCTYLSEVL